MAEIFCLKWNDFSSNVSKSFRLLRSADYLHDVTLVGDDHKQVSAHKLVLSACSEYFRNIFKNNANKNVHPLLCLDGMSSADLENIVEYIYNGEVKIYQDNLDRFLTIAQRFKLEGLLSSKEEPSQDHVQESQDIYTPTQNYESLEETVIAPKSNVKSRNDHHPETNFRDIASKERILVPVSAEQMNDIDNKASQHVEKCEDGRFRCTLCGQTSKGTDARYKMQMKYHVEGVHLEGISIPCQLCGKTFRSRNSLRTHKSLFHK